MVYRLVNSVYVMTVAAAHTNVFYTLQLVEGAVRVLVAACKGVDVTPDKVTRRYPEVGAAAVSRGSSSGRPVPSWAAPSLLAACPSGPVAGEVLRGFHPLLAL